jgi:hypothetical protein
MNLPLLHRRLAGVAKVKIKEKTQFEHFFHRQSQSEM